MAIPRRRADPEHVRAQERTFFVTSSIWDKRRLLQSERSAGLLVEVLYDYRKQGKYRLHEFVIMLDHCHVLITVDAGMTIERAAQFIKGGFSFRAARYFGWKGEVWQRGFSEVRVLDENPIAGTAHISGRTRCVHIGWRNPMTFLSARLTPDTNWILRPRG